MRLQELYRGDVEEVRKWRNENISSFRTSYLLTQEQQQDFYDKVTQPESPHRYWTIYENGLVGLGGITNIQWENSIGEISLIIGPAYRQQGFGIEAVELILDWAFGRIGLKTVFGECYMNGPVDFWKKIANKYNAYTTNLPNRKFWGGKYWNAFYFSIDCDEYRKIQSAIHEA